MKDITLVLLWLAERALDKIAPITGPIYSHDSYDDYPKKPETPEL